jgi:hypothetical protein
MSTPHTSSQLLMNIILTENGPVTEDGSPTMKDEDHSVVSSSRTSRSHSWVATSLSIPSSPISCSVPEVSRRTTVQQRAERNVIYTENGPIEA